MSPRRPRRIPHPAGLIAELADLRSAHEATGTWRARPVDAPCKVPGCELTKLTHDRCRVCTEPLEHHDEELCWSGKARLAKARERAGEPLTMVDIEALDRYPDPPSVWFPGRTVREVVADMAAEQLGAVA